MCHDEFFANVYFDPCIMFFLTDKFLIKDLLSSYFTSIYNLIPGWLFFKQLSSYVSNTNLEKIIKII